jgi:anti-sigma factor RsiW
MNSHHLHPDCTYTRQSLPLYSGGDLSRAALARVEAHVRQCKSCASLTQRAQEARRVLVLGVQVRAEGPVPSLLSQIQASPTVTPAVVMSQPALSQSAQSRLRLVRWTAAAAAAGVLGFLALRVPQVAPQVATPVVSQAVPNPTTPHFVPIPVSAAGVAAVDGDALRPLQASEMPLRHSATRTIEVPWMENNAGRVLTPGGSVSTVGWTTR